MKAGGLNKWVLASCLLFCSNFLVDLSGIEWSWKKDWQHLLSLPQAKWQKQWKQPFQPVTGTSTERLSTRMRQRWEKVFEPWSRMAWWKGRICSSSVRCAERVKHSGHCHVSFINATLESWIDMLLSSLLHFVAVVHLPQEVHGKGELWEDSQWS